MRQASNRVGAKKNKTRVLVGAAPPATRSGVRDPSVIAVEAVYDAALDPSRWPDALQAIANALGDVGAILLWRRDDGTFGSVASPKVIEAQEDFEQEGWMAHDLRALRAAERGHFFSGEPFTDRHVCSDEEIGTDPSYTEFQARHGLGWFGAIAVSPDPHVGIVLSVHRAKTRPPFSDEELSTVAQIGRHVEKSLRLSIRLLDAELLKLGLGEALARVGIGVFAVDSCGRVIFVNPAGKHLLGDGLALRKDRLVPSQVLARTMLETAIQQRDCFTPETITALQRPILIHRRKTDRPLAIYVMPTGPMSHPATQFLAYAHTIILVIDPEASGPADPAVVRDVLGLTLGEARIAALIGSGLTLNVASKRLGITEATARSVLKHVFSKTGVSRQSELVSLLTRMVLH